jgi:hypothetical protein
MLDHSVSQINETFLEMLESPEMHKEAERRGAEYLKTQIYEDSFMEKILPAQPISPAQLDRTVDSPNYQVVIDKEFAETRAVTVGLRGLADYQYVEEDRYAVNFFKIESDEYEKTEGEIRGMRQPIQNLIRHNTAFQIRKQMDRSFIGACEAAIALDAANQQFDTSDSQITPENLVELRNLLDDRNINGQYVRAATLLMTHSQWNNISTWIQGNTGGVAGGGVGAAGGITTDFWKDGYQYDSLFGLRVVKTIKSDLVDKDTIYAFTEPELLGHQFTFNDDRFAIQKHFDRVKWKAWRTFGFSIGNSYSVVKMRLNQ